ncbi:SRPBCC family protein [Krasilnikovia sp. MM14-A1259]|uniref:SRPBCC family protein n=1 Tax=Krasilnikovia sp. MM14-A1259 TaxID=3373539 RepID=UPI00380A4DC3
MRTTDFDAGPPADATVVPDGDTWTLVFIRDLKHPPDRVWRALTDPAEIDQWAPFAAARDLAEPGDTTLTMIDGDTRADQPATVVRAEAPRVLEYTWGADRLRWELDPDGAGTRLTLRHTLAQPEMDAMVAAGWHLCIAVLARLLDGTPVGVIRGRDALAYGWDDLRAAYAQRLRH